MNTYQTKYSNQSKCKNNCSIELDLINKKVKVSSLGWLKIRGYRHLKNINGKIINATISQEKNGKYYVSVLYNIKEPQNIQHSPRNIIGIDVGVKTLLTMSDGTTYKNNRYIEKYEKRIKRLQRELSRKTKYSNNYYKCKKKLAILHSKLKNSRNYYIHNITKKITDEYDIITCEKLQIQKMLTNKSLSKKISDASFYEIIRQLEYKSKFKGKLFYQIDLYYPSSQECSVCSSIDKNYKDISKREYDCHKCHHHMDRDLNASINVMYEGLKLYLQEKLKI